MRILFKANKNNEEHTIILSKAMNSLVTRRAKYINVKKLGEA